MPRGKVTTLTSPVQQDSGESARAAHRDADKKSIAKFTLITPESLTGEVEEAVLEGHVANDDASMPGSLSFRFTLLLVALFVLVNAGLIALLDNDKPKNHAAKPAGEPGAAVLSQKALSQEKVSSPAVAPAQPKAPVEAPAIGASQTQKPVSAKPAMPSSSGQDELLSIIGKD